jgi:hypothetical protein
MTVDRDASWDPVSWTPAAPYEAPRYCRFAPLEGAAPVPLCNPASSKLQGMKLIS